MPDVTLTFNLAKPDPRDPVPIYHLGQAFFLAGNRCLLNIEVGPGVTQCLTSPGVVNLCLAIELFLKSIIVANGATPPKSHNLIELCSVLPSDLSGEIRASYDALVPNPVFDDLLNQVNDYFVKVRYGFEFNIFAFYEYPVYAIAKVLFERSAHLQKVGLERINV